LALKSHLSAGKVFRKAVSTEQDLQTASWNRSAQLILVLVCALLLKLYYSTASPDDLRWILAPTTTLVELVSGTQFAFESHAGYLSANRSFLIAGSCAGINFLITAFLMLSLRKLWRDRPHRWTFIPVAAASAYLATLIANTARISTALHLGRMHLKIGGLSGNDLHRFEGIIIYFGFLLLLFMVSERTGSGAESPASPLDGNRVLVLKSRKSFGLLRQFFFPLLVYYATTLGIPLTTAILRGGIAATVFWQHAAFVLLTPLLLLLPFAAFHLWKGKKTLFLGYRASLLLGPRASRPQ
jgi:exosortase K